METILDKLESVLDNIKEILLIFFSTTTLWFIVEYSEFLEVYFKIFRGKVTCIIFIKLTQARQKVKGCKLLSQFPLLAIMEKKGLNLTYHHHKQFEN